MPSIKDIALALDAMVDVRFVGVSIFVAATFALVKYRKVIEQDHQAIWSKVIPAATGGGAAALALVAITRLLRANDPNLCAELSRGELATLYALNAVVAVVGGYVSLFRAFGSPAPNAVAPPAAAAEPPSGLGTGKPPEQQAPAK